MTPKGFTLIELLVVIAIVTVLSVVVVLTLNPAELLRQARDSNRLSDLDTLNRALALYLSDVTSPSLTNQAGTCFTSNSVTTASCGGRFSSNYATSSASISRAVDGTGWIPVNFNLISSGSPLGNLPSDPTNNTSSLYYAYAATSTTYEINANMESVKFSQGGGADAETADGGNSPDLYEIGTDPGIDL